MDCNLPGFSIHGDSPGKNAGCHALLRGSSQLKDWAQVSRTAGGFFMVWATREDPKKGMYLKLCLSLDASCLDFPVWPFKEFPPRTVIDFSNSISLLVSCSVGTHHLACCAPLNKCLFNKLLKISLPIFLMGFFNMSETFVIWLKIFSHYFYVFLKFLFMPIFCCCCCCLKVCVSMGLCGQSYQFFFYCIPV